MELIYCEPEGARVNSRLVKARELLRVNIDRLLGGEPRVRLTESLGRPSSWLSQILSEGEHSRGVFLDHIDAISGHFRVEPGELFKAPNSHIDNGPQPSKIAPSNTQQEREKTEGASMHDDPDPRRDHKRQEVLAIYDYAKSRTDDNPAVIKAIVDEIDGLVRRRVDEYRNARDNKRADGEVAKKL